MFTAKTSIASSQHLMTHGNKSCATLGQTLLKFEKKKDINTQFKFLSTIGKGAYGSVILVESAIDPTDTEIYAIKILKY